MVNIKYEHDRFTVDAEQSVLECLTSHGVPVPFSCRSGACQTCLMRASRGQPPAESQVGLKDSLKLQNYFLACVCHPREDMEVNLPQGAEPARIPATVKGLRLLNADIMELILHPHGPIAYRPGQFLNLFRDRHLGRSYSIASLPQEDPYIHLHVRRLPEGRVSGWIHQQLRPGRTVEIQGPGGHCFYVPGRGEQSLLLIGTGSGLAPLYGIVRDALHRGHTGPIRLFHGSRDRKGLYLEGELADLVRQYPNFDYVPCLSGEHVPRGYSAGRAHEVALAEARDLKAWRVFLCGHPEMVNSARKRAFLAGASMKEIYADAFNISQSLPLAG